MFALVRCRCRCRCRCCSLQLPERARSSVRPGERGFGPMDDGRVRSGLALPVGVSSTRWRLDNVVSSEAESLQLSAPNEPTQNAANSQKTISSSYPSPSPSPSPASSFELRALSAERRASGIELIWGQLANLFAAS